MTDIKDPLIHDLVLWCDRSPRTYAEVLEAWRTSCPRLTVWEDAIERGLLETRPSGSDVRGLMVVVTDRGRTWLKSRSSPPFRLPVGPAAAVARTRPDVSKYP